LFKISPKSYGKNVGNQLLEDGYWISEYPMVSVVVATVVVVEQLV